MIPEIAKALDTTIGYIMGWEQTDNSSYHLTAEEKEIINLYRQADQNDKEVIKHILKRYEQDTALSVG